MRYGQVVGRRLSPSVRLVTRPASVGTSQPVGGAAGYDEHPVHPPQTPQGSALGHARATPEDSGGQRHGEQRGGGGRLRQTHTAKPDLFDMKPNGITSVLVPSWGNETSFTSFH